MSSSTPFLDFLVKMKLFNNEIERKTYFGFQFSNRYGNPTATFGPGIYGFGNSALGKPFKKITYGLRLFKEKLKMLDDENVNEQELMKQFLDILIDQTRSHTIVLVNGVGRCTYFERSRKQLTPISDVTWDDTTHYFDLDDL
ncbi:Transport and Golgi organization protein [Dirofilaria immitis]